MTHEEFYNELSGFEQESILVFARAYMRVRELHNDKNIHETARQAYAELEAKLAEQMGEDQ